MKFLCGRPGCGKESTATLQIDAPSETVSLVDPRISRDGVPLCARHADATTPPMGWTMNDLRSRNRALAAVPDEGTVPTSTPPRVRPEAAASTDADGLAPEAERKDGEGRSRRGGSHRRMSRRQSIEERARRTAEVRAEAGATTDETVDEVAIDEVAVNEVTGGPENTPARSASARRRRADGDGAPESRPSKRRDTPDDAGEDEDRFPWHHQYKDDEPQEMQASSPLLSRAFRSSTG